MAKEIMADVNLDIGAALKETVQKQLDSGEIEINADLSEDSLRNIEDKIEDLSAELDLNISDSFDKIGDKFESIGDKFDGVAEGMADKFDDINDALEDMKKNMDDVAEANERNARSENLKLSNELVKNAMTGVAGATSLGAIRAAGDDAASLQILSERTGIDYNLLGRFVTGLTTGNELMSFGEATGATENISNAITDLLTGTSPDGARLLNLLGVKGTDITREGVIQSIIGASSTDFGSNQPEVNRLFEQILGINFNALRGANFQENLFADQGLSEAIRDSQRELEAEYREFTQNISYVNVGLNKIGTFLASFANNWIENTGKALSDIYSGTKNLFKPKDFDDYEDLANVSYGDKLQNFDDVGNVMRWAIQTDVNSRMEDIIGLRNLDKTFRDNIDLSGLREVMGDDLKLQRNEMTAENMAKLGVKLDELKGAIREQKLKVDIHTDNTMFKGMIDNSGG